MNNELTLIGLMLNDNKKITEIDIDPRWFETPVCQMVAAVLLTLAGTDYRLSDVYREMKAKFPANCGTLEDLELIADGVRDLGITHQMAEMIHRDFIERDLKRVSGAFSVTGSNAHAKELADLLTERDALATVKSDGGLDKALEEFDRLAETPELLLTTFDCLDQFLGGGLGAGQLIVIGARPGVGKTAMGLAMADKILDKNKGSRVDFFSLEMTQWQLLSRLASKKANINATLLKNPHALAPINRTKVRNVLEGIKMRDFRVFTSEYEQLNDICYMIKRRALANRYVAFIDYAGLIGVKDSRKNERQVLNEVTRRLKKLTTDLDITIVLFSQLNRGVESRQVKKPTLADLKESGSLEQDANVVMLLSKDEDDPKGQRIFCDIAKNREGILGTAPFKFIGQFMNFDTDYDIWRGA